MISVVIPCYNHNQEVKRAVKSALAQEGLKDIIIVDDGSATPVSNEWGEPVRVIRHRRNLGLSAALNTGIKHAKGTRFVILASDDQLDPNYFGIMSGVDADIVSCDMRAGGKHIYSKAGSLRELMNGNCHSYAALIKREIWERIGGFKTTMNPSWEDWEFFLNAAKHNATWWHVGMPLHVYNRNPVGRDADAQGKDALLWAKLQGYHQDLYGKGKGVVAFIIPCYDQEKFVGEAIQSCYDQVFPHVKVVVVDDGSPGRIIKAVEAYASDDLLLVRQHNKHLSGARNAGIQAAAKHFNPQYMVMLDADDTVHPEFLEQTLGLYSPNRYVYTDIQFIGDANHKFETPDYDCEKLVRKHLHSCTFLAETKLYQDIFKSRGYIYDEEMKQGYEDWELALAAIRVEWCGQRLRLPLFNYRHHSNGSMRTAANKINSELVKYVKSKHPWMLDAEEVKMGCKTCGGMRSKRILIGNNSGGVAMKVFVPGVGEVEGDAQLQVHYNGVTTSTMTKHGMGGQIYKYSGNPSGTFGPDFSIFARDAHLFAGPFDVKQFAPPQVVQQAAQPVVSKPTTLPEPVVQQVSTEKQKVEELNQKLATITYEPDDFTELKDVGEVSAKRLQAAGFSYFEDIADAAVDELATVLKQSKTKAKQVQQSAKDLLKELSE